MKIVYVAKRIPFERNPKEEVLTYSLTAYGVCFAMILVDVMLKLPPTPSKSETIDPSRGAEYRYLLQVAKNYSDILPKSLLLLSIMVENKERLPIVKDVLASPVEGIDIVPGEWEGAIDRKLRSFLIKHLADVTVIYSQDVLIPHNKLMELFESWGIRKEYAKAMKDYVEKEERYLQEFRKRL